MRLRVAALGLLALAGCIRLGRSAPDIHTYRLDYPPPPPSGAPLPVVLNVSPLGVAATYDRDRIVYRQGAFAVGTYFYDRWSANPGNMIGDLLARDFASAQEYRAVQQGPSMLPADYQLSGHIEEIEERARATGCGAHLQLRMLLVRLRAGVGDPVRLQKTYVKEQPCACNKPESLAAAMSGALQQLSAQLQLDVHTAIAADRP